MERGTEIRIGPLARQQMMIDPVVAGGAPTLAKAVRLRTPRAVQRTHGAAGPRPEVHRESEPTSLQKVIPGDLRLAELDAARQDAPIAVHHHQARLVWALRASRHHQHDRQRRHDGSRQQTRSSRPHIPALTCAPAAQIADKPLPRGGKGRARLVRDAFSRSLSAKVQRRYCARRRVIWLRRWSYHRRYSCGTAPDFDRLPPSASGFRA